MGGKKIGSMIISHGLTELAALYSMAIERRNKASGESTAVS